MYFTCFIKGHLRQDLVKVFRYLLFFFLFCFPKTLLWWQSGPNRPYVLRNILNNTRSVNRSMPINSFMTYTPDKYARQFYLIIAYIGCVKNARGTLLRRHLLQTRCRRILSFITLTVIVLYSFVLLNKIETILLI